MRSTCSEPYQSGKTTIIMWGRKSYPSDVSNEEWSFFALYLNPVPARHRAAQTLTARGVQHIVLRGAVVVPSE